MSRAFKALPRAALLSCAALLVSTGITSAQDRCRQALALGLDVSGSVDPREYRMQLDGLVAAFLHPEVQHALLSMTDIPVRLAVFEWSGSSDQTLLVDWLEIRSLADLTRVTATLTQTERTPAELSTGLGNAMIYGKRLLEQQQGCWVRTLDISGDGKSNTGPRPQDIPDIAFDGMIINALVIGADSLDHGDDRQADVGELSSYFNTQVIHGHGSFTEVAIGFEDYEAAMVRKLKRELAGLAVSSIIPQPNTPPGQRPSGVIDQ